MATNGAKCSSENWAVFMDICDAINSSEEGPKEASKTIRKRFACKDSASLLLTLKLLETCVKNCGKRFHIFVATKEFMQEMIKIISPKHNPSVELQNTVLSLIQTWAFAFQSSPELREVSKHYQELKSKGVEFPVLDPDLASQTFIPEKSASPVVATDAAVHRGSKSGSAMSPTGHYAVRQTHSPPVTMYQPSLVSGPDKITKLRSELGTVQQNCRVFGEILTELSSGGGSADDIALLEDLNSTCRQMQRRIVELLETCQIEQVTEDLLAVNDELNNVFLRYDRYQRMRAGRAAAQPEPTTAAPAVCPVQPPQYTPEPASPTHVMLPPVYSPRPQEAERGVAGSTAVSTSVSAGSSGTNDAAVGQLIDFGNDTPSPGPTNAVANLSLGGGAAFSATASQSAALNSASEPLQLNDRETDLAEMEHWLKANPNEAAVGESVTSAEFDHFLSERVREAERMPSISSRTTTGQTLNAGPTSQPPPDGELFSL